MAVLANLTAGGCKMFPSVRGGRNKFDPVLRGEGHNKFWTCDSPIL